MAKAAARKRADEESGAEDKMEKPVVKLCRHIKAAGRGKERETPSGGHRTRQGLTGEDKSWTSEGKKGISTAEI